MPKALNRVGLPLILAAGLAPVLAMGGGHPSARAVTRAVTQPAPPVSANAFPVEAAGIVPSDGDGKIPNRATPTGSAPGPVSHCDYTADSSNGATSATVNSRIAAVENSITKRYVLCLSGTFTSPIHVWSKWSSAMLVIEAAPGSSAHLSLGQVRASDVNPNDHDGGDAGGVDITDSRDVEVEGLDITGYWAKGPNYAPVGILVTVRESTQLDQSKLPHQSACFVKSADHACGDIYLIDNTISGIVNRADEVASSSSYCNNGNVGAFGIAVLSYGHDDAHGLQHVVIEGNTVSHTRTGQSETVTVNGDVKDFLEADNRVYDTDNIGMDAIGWEEGTDQARHGLIVGNTVANVDTWGNHSYGRFTGGTCTNLPENAAGIYDDGGSYIWIDHNTVFNTDQGIDADVETAYRYTDHILVTSNTVVDSPGTSLGDPSTGSNPSGIPGSSTVAGHGFEAFYVDAFGRGSLIEHVYAHGNTFRNESQFYGATSPQVAPVVDVGGKYEHVMVWDNRIQGYSVPDRLNPLFELDNQPVSSAPDVFDCTDYGDLSASSSGAGNFVSPTASYLTLAAWQAHNGHGYDANSTVGATSCPAARP